MEQYEETIDLREIMVLLKKNIIIIAAAAIVFGLVGFLVSTFAMTPQYRASAMLIVNSRQIDGTQSSVTSDQLNSASKLVDTYAVILTSDTVLEKTIDQLDLDMTYSQLANKVSISAVDSTQVMRVSVQDADPELAREIVANIVEQAPEVIINTVKAGSVEIISEAKAGTAPVSPNITRNTALAAMVGLVLAVGVVFLRYMLNNKFRTDSDINNRLGLTVLGVIPQIDTKEKGA